MVHRIQNRNPGYSDFSNLASKSSFNFSNNASAISEGANALKLENEVVSENLNQSIDEVNSLYHEELVKNQVGESIEDNISNDKEISFSEEVRDTNFAENENSNNLKEFGVNTDEPDLFNNENQDSHTEDLLESSTDENEEDDLEIPAFLEDKKIDGLRENKWKPPWYWILQNISTAKRNY